MITSDGFCQALDERGIRFATGVPCSFFSGPIAQLTSQRRYLAAANEGAALALAAGSCIAGTRAAVLAQNSGLGNMINPLTSLVCTYRIPVLVLMSLRGWPDPGGDEPQHALMGEVTHRLLDTIGVSHWTVLRSDVDIRPVLGEAEQPLSKGLPAFILFERGAIEPRPAAPAASARLTRAEALAVLMPLVGGLPIVSTTGYTSRELFAQGDADSHFYMQGSMGHATALALGLALERRRPGTPTVVLDGDGAALMHLGTMSTIGSCAPVNVLHVIFDNGLYESTGAQPTTSATTDLAEVARAAGYASGSRCETTDEIDLAVKAALATPGPHAVVIPTGPMRTAPAGRATTRLSAPEIHRRFADVVRRR